MTDNKKRTYIVFVLLIIATILVCGVYSFRMYTSSIHVNADNSMEGNWICSASSSTYYSLELPIQLNNYPDSPLILSHKLPSELSENSAVYFRSSQQSVAVYINNVLTYEYHSPGSRITGHATPSNWNFIMLHPEDAGKDFRIELTSPYKLYTGRANHVYIGNFYDLNANLLKHVLPGYICATILLFFGIIIVFTSHIFSRENPGIVNFRYLGLFTILLSIWMRSETKLPNYLLFDPHFEVFMEFCALMLCPLPYILFVKHRFSPKINKLLNILFYLFSINFIVSLILQFAGICDLVESSITIPILVVITAFIVGIQYLFQLIHRERNYYIFSIFAFISLIFSIAIEILLFLFGRFEAMGYGFRVGMCIYVICLTFTAVQGIISNELLSAQASEQILKRQIKMMMSHIQPHFLFNSLGAIQSLIKKSPDTAYQMLFDFSKYLRASINAWNNQVPIPFSSEIDNVKAFTNIQLIRFRNNFRIEFDIDEADFSVPILSIRALVENGVNHGARRSTYEIPYVKIHSYKTNDYYIVEVIDNGPGFDVAEKLSSSDSTSGLHRCKHVLELLMNATLTIHSIPGKGTTCIVRIPR